MASNNHAPHSLKILIVSTPKTGNTWLKLLLAETYRLPIPAFPPALDVSAWRDLGPRWVAHQHYLPDPALLEWGRNNGVIFLTTVRHPGDVFVSLSHYMQRDSVAPSDDPGAPEHLKAGEAQREQRHRAYLEHGFYLLLQNSLSWICGRHALPVRYEELYRTPFETLKRVTDAIVPVSEAQLRSAIEHCELGRLRKRAAAEREFFRRGGEGAWRVELPAEFRRTLLATEPYRTQLRLLGYSTEGMPAYSGIPATSLIARSPVLMEFSTEFRRAQLGTPTPLMGPAAFIRWLNHPCDRDLSADDGPRLSNLCVRIYQREAAAVREYPDPFGRNRSQVASWFLHFGMRGYGLHRIFAQPLVQSWPGATVPFTPGTAAHAA